MKTKINDMKTKINIGILLTIFVSALIPVFIFWVQVDNSMIEREEYVVDPEINETNVTIGIERPIKNLDYIIYIIEDETYLVDDDNLEKSITFEIDEDKIIECEAFVYSDKIWITDHSRILSRKNCDLKFRMGEWITLERIVL